MQQRKAYFNYIGEIFGLTIWLRWRSKLDDPNILTDKIRRLNVTQNTQTRIKLLIIRKK